MKALLVFSILATTTLFSQATKAQQPQDLSEDNLTDITEGKIQSGEALWLKDLDKNISDKQQKALALINLVSIQANTSAGLKDETTKGDVEYAHVGFVARFQGIREDREMQARKDFQPDYATLMNYSRRLDSLVTDLQTFLK